MAGIFEGSPSLRPRIPDGPPDSSAFVSGHEIPFPGKRRLRLQRLVRDWRLLNVEAQYMVLPRPFGGQVAETGDAHSLGQAAFDGCFDEIWCKEGE